MPGPQRANPRGPEQSGGGAAGAGVCPGGGGGGGGRGLGPPRPPDAGYLRRLFGEDAGWGGLPECISLCI